MDRSAMSVGLGPRVSSVTSVPSAVATAIGGPPELRATFEVGMPSPKSAEDLDDGGVFDISLVQPSSGSCVKKGVLAMQRDRGLLSRWRDRYFMLMPDYLACFKKSSSAPVRGFPAGSGMGSFQFKLSLVDIESAEWADGTGLVIALNVKNDARLLLRCVGDGRDVGNSPGNAGHGSPAGFFPLTHSASTPTVVASAAAAAAAGCTTPGQLKDWLRAIQSAVSCSKTRREALRNANRSGFDPTALKQRIVYERSVLDATENSSLVKDTAKDPLSPLNHSVSILQAQQTRLMSNKVDKKYQRFSLLPDLNLSRYLDSWGFGSSSSSTNNRTSNVTGSASPANSDSSCSSTSSGGSTSSASSTSSRDSGIGNGTNGYHHQSSTPSPLASSAVLAAASKRGNRYDMRPQSYADPLCTTDSPGTQPVLVKFRDRSTGENNIRLYVNSPSSSPIKAGPSSNSSPARHVYVSPATHV